MPLTRPHGTPGVSVFYRIPACLGTGTRGPAGAGGSQAVLTRLLSPSSSSSGMWCPLRPFLLALLLASACRTLGPRGRRDDGGGEPESAEPQWGRLKGSNVSRPLPPAAFHEENTVTTEWATDGEEEEDYLDLGQIFGEDGDDYGDVVDADPPPRPGAGAGSVLPLFPGKSRVQRLNLLNAQFAFDLYRALAARAGTADNIFLAPVGVSAAMAMLSLGLAGDTHQEVHAALRFAEFVNASTAYELGTVHNLFRKLTHRLFRRDFGYTLRSVSDLYVQKQLPVLDDFKAKVREYYFAEVRAADFSDPAFLAHTNRHVARLTKGLIRDALQDVDPATQMLLLNCLYFKGRRQHGPGLDLRAGERGLQPPPPLPLQSQAQGGLQGQGRSRRGSPWFTPRCGHYRLLLSASPSRGRGTAPPL